MSKYHYEAYDNAGLILEGYFWDVDDVKETLQKYKWLKGKEIQIINTSENTLAALITL